MKSFLKFAFVFLILAASLAAQSQQDMLKQTMAAEPPFKLEIGFDLGHPRTGAPHEHSVVSGTAMSLGIRKTNITDHPIMKRSQTGGSYGYDFEVRDSNGNRVGPRYPNKHTYYAGGAGDIVLGTKDMVLQPGESVVDIIPLASWFDIRKPGDYTVQASAHVSDDPKSDVVKSNIITITVKPEPTTSESRQR